MATQAFKIGRKVTIKGAESLGPGQIKEWKEPNDSYLIEFAGGGKGWYDKSIMTKYDEPEKKDGDDDDGEPQPKKPSKGRMSRAGKRLQKAAAAAAWQTASRQAVKAIAKGVPKALLLAGLSEENATAVAGLLQTPMGEAILAVLLGSSLTLVEDLPGLSRLQLNRLADELQVLGAGYATNMVADKAGGVIMATLAEVKLPPLLGKGEE